MEYTDMQNAELDRQIIFKLGAIEAEVKSLGSQLTDTIHNLSDRIGESNIQSAAKVSKLEAKVEKNADEIQKLKDWKNTIVAKVAGATSVVAIFWLVFGDAIGYTVEHII